MTISVIYYPFNYTHKVLIINDNNELYKFYDIATDMIPSFCNEQCEKLGCANIQFFGDKQLTSELASKINPNIRISFEEIK